MNFIWRTVVVLVFSLSFSSLGSFQKLPEIFLLSVKTIFVDYRNDEPFLHRLHTYVEMSLVEILREFSLYKEPISLVKNWPKIREIIKGNIPATPTGIELLPTTECNLNCGHCRSGSRKEFIADRSTYSEVEMERYVGELLEQGVKEFRISGITGDPLMKLSKEATLLAAKKVLKFKHDHFDSSFQLGLVTNGVNLDEEARQVFVYGDYVQVSLDGVSEADFRDLKKRPAFEEVMENINQLARLKEELNTNVTLRVSFLIRDFPRRYLDNVIRQLKGLGVDQVVFKMAWGDLNKGYVFSFEELLETYAYLAQLQNKYVEPGDSFDVIIADTPEEVGEINKDKGLRSEVHQCYYARLRATLSEKGELVSCCHKKQNGLPVLGDAKKDSIPAVWQSAAFQEKLKSIDPAKDCSSCFRSAHRLNQLVDFLVHMSKRFPGFLDWFETAYIRVGQNRYEAHHLLGLNQLGGPPVVFPISDAPLLKGWHRLEHLDPVVRLSAPFYSHIDSVNSSL